MLTFRCLSPVSSLKPQPLLQPHISHQLPSTRPPPGGRRTLGLLVSLHVPGRLLLPAARRVRPLLLAGSRHPFRAVLPLHPAEVRGRPRARCAATVLHHGRVLHDGAGGSVLASGRRGGLAGREDRPLGHSDQAAKHQAESGHRRPWTHRGPVDLGGGEDEEEGGRGREGGWEVGNGCIWCQNAVSCAHLPQHNYWVFTTLMSVGGQS